MVQLLFKSVLLQAPHVMGDGGGGKDHSSSC
jgi:hypothetical protein